MKDQIIMTYLEDVLREMILESILNGSAPVSEEQINCRITSAMFDMTEIQKRREE